MSNLQRWNNAFDSIFVMPPAWFPMILIQDGYIDLFIGGRSVPGNYGQVPQSYLLENDENGHFKDVTAKYVKTSQYWICKKCSYGRFE